MKFLEIQFQDLINNPEETINKIHHFLPQLKPYQEVKEEVAIFLDPDLKHKK